MTGNIDNPCRLSEDRVARLLGTADRVTTVGELLAWGRRAPDLFSSQGVLTDVVVQDEFTHDLVVGLTDGLVLVYGST